MRYPEGIKDTVLLASIIKPVLEAIIYLHNNSQIHRSIKGSNILLSKNGLIKLSDFGLSSKIKKNEKKHTLCGSACWMAPEVLDNDGQGYDLKADIWSLGMTAIEMARGSAPYSKVSGMKAILKILHEDPPS